jgi:iron complex transport system substrate-binding protein
MRVVSLLPSATELLCAIGGRGLLVGRSHECDYPADVAGVPVVTASRLPRVEAVGAREMDRLVREGVGQAGGGEGLYSLDEGRLAELEPDLILTQDLCAVCSVDVASVRRIAERLKRKPEVLSLNPHSFEDVLEDLLSVGRATGLEGAARDAVMGLRSRVYSACDYVNGFADGPSVVFIEWTDPLFVAGHWTPQLIERAGGRHPLNPSVAKPTAGAGAGPVGMTLRAAGKSVRVPAEVMAAVRPEAVIVGPCGVALEGVRAMLEPLRAEAWWKELPAVRAGRVALVDGNQSFSRPGPRLVDGFEWLVGWLNDRPEVMPPREVFAWEAL